MATGGKIYELGYLLTPTLPVAAALAWVAEHLKQPLNSAGAKLVGEGLPQTFSLAYPIRQLVENRYQIWREAYFGWLRFAVDGPEALEAVAVARRAPALIRVLLLNYPRVTVTKRPVAPRRPAAPTSMPAPAAPGVQAALDKEIDALLVNVPQ